MSGGWWGRQIVDKEVPPRAPIKISNSATDDGSDFGAFTAGTITSGIAEAISTYPTWTRYEFISPTPYVCQGPINLPANYKMNWGGLGKRATLIQCDTLANVPTWPNDQNGNKTLINTNHSTDTSGWTLEKMGFGAQSRTDISAVGDFIAVEGSHIWNPRDLLFDGTNTATRAAQWNGNEDMFLTMVAHQNADWDWDAHAGAGLMINCSMNKTAHLQHQEFGVVGGTSQGKWSLENAHAGGQLPTYSWLHHTINPTGSPTFVVQNATATTHSVNWTGGRIELDPTSGTVYAFDDASGAIGLVMGPTGIINTGAGTLQVARLLKAGSTYVRLGAHLTSGTITDNPTSHLP